jgi:hypothetical protein
LGTEYYNGAVRAIVDHNFIEEVTYKYDWASRNTLGRRNGLLWVFSLPAAR